MNLNALNRSNVGPDDHVSRKSDIDQIQFNSGNQFNNILDPVSENEDDELEDEDLFSDDDLKPIINEQGFLTFRSVVNKKFSKKTNIQTEFRQANIEN